MLVLSRQRDETIIIGDEIEITVVDIRGDKVRLGITAPTRIAVHRKEVYEAIKKENEQAARALDAELPRLTGTGVPISPGPLRGKTATKAARLVSPTPPTLRATPVSLPAPARPGAEPPPAIRQARPPEASARHA
jgi:carbon storage regulator